MPLLGGIIADRVTGQRNAVMIGLVLMALGHLSLALDGLLDRNAGARELLPAALALVAVGNGFMKPNIATLVGRLYGAEPAKRDAGFSIFTMGVSLGAFASALVCGSLADRFGWSAGFGAAGIGMLIGLATFIRGRRSLPEDPMSRLPLWLPFFCAVLVASAWLLMQSHIMVGLCLVLGAFGTIGWLAYQAMQSGSPRIQGRVIAGFVLTGACVILWFLNDQAAGSLNLLADRHVPRVVLGLRIPAPVYLSLNPLFIIALAPLLAQLWIVMARRGGDLATATKFAIGLVFVALGMGVLTIPCRLAGADGLISPAWLVLSFLLGAIGELLISPIGLSAITRLSMPGLASTMMGLWFLGIAGGDFLAQEAGKLASLAVPDPASTSLDGYWSLFAWLGAIGLAAAAVMALMRPLLGRLMGETAAASAR
jgi:POT family proton-dependent oligopeptide transporter